MGDYGRISYGSHHHVREPIGLGDFDVHLYGPYAEFSSAITKIEYIQMKEDNLSKKRLQKVIEGYLDRNVKIPTFQTIEKDFTAQDKLADILLISLVMIEYIQKQGLDFDKDYLEQLPKQEIGEHKEVIEKFVQTGHLSQEAIEILQSASSRKYLLGYLFRELNWVAISILSASYLSAHIIMRSVFELLIVITTRKTGSMNKRINSISFLSLQEREEIENLWKDLCGWVHPFSKWVEEMCPIFVSHGPIYHPVLCKKCLEELEELVDLLLVVGLRKFKISSKDISTKIKAHRIDTANLTLFQSRR